MAGIDVQPYLRKLNAPAAAEALLAYFEHNAQQLAKGRLANSDGKSGAGQSVIAWLESAEIQDRIWRHYGSA
ncbi:hypothetical protein DK842_20935 [Chromobacterium phragmitis]|uniref:Uncharacterized protein n=1 Tax=Chromobacterium phragmitis TaxID=2202141 RepID=A0A344UE43_9NEIS|nr:hypothetical protein [Chromobacterium phragmitis]AXE32150.1 hypothetical protein DK842_20935 [Chromobacterium phragmitis]AXE33541.1 hypothetical protein DK843_03925 [Chromobacterium phragmitis]